MSLLRIRRNFEQAQRRGGACVIAMEFEGMRGTIQLVRKVMEMGTYESITLGG